MAMKIECDRCGVQTRAQQPPSDWTTLELGATSSRVSKLIDVCGSCAQSALKFMERLPTAVEKVD